MKLWNPLESLHLCFISVAIMCPLPWSYLNAPSSLHWPGCLDTYRGCQQGLHGFYAMRAVVPTSSQTCTRPTNCGDLTCDLHSLVMPVLHPEAIRISGSMDTVVLSWHSGARLAVIIMAIIAAVAWSHWEAHTGWARGQCHTVANS